MMAFIFDRDGSGFVFHLMFEDIGVSGNWSFLDFVSSFLLFSFFFFFFFSFFVSFFFWCLCRIPSQPAFKRRMRCFCGPGSIHTYRPMMKHNSHSHFPHFSFRFKRREKREERREKKRSNQLNRFQQSPTCPPKKAL